MGRYISLGFMFRVVAVVEAIYALFGLLTPPELVLPVTGNGDVRSVDDARAMVAATACAAVMIGRGALGRPWIFRGVEVSRDERVAVIRRHCALIEARLPERPALIQLGSVP